MSETDTVMTGVTDMTEDTLESAEQPVTPEQAETERALSPAVLAEMAECEKLTDGIDALGFGVDMRTVTARAEISGLCRVLVNSGVIPEETLQREIFAGIRQILAATHQDCEVQLAKMPPQQRAAHLAAAAARRAALEAEAEQQSDPVLQAAKSPSGKKSNLQVVRSSDQLLIARR